MLRRIYPWLLPLAVSVLLVLSFGIAERLRRNTPEGKFNRVQLGMQREEVHRILGEPEGKLDILGPGSAADEWTLGDQITIYYDWPEGRVRGKMMEIYRQTFLP